VEQPVGTGFSQGEPNIRVRSFDKASVVVPESFFLFISGQNEDDLAEQLVGFLQQFLEVFSELKNKKFYVSGESVCCSFGLCRSSLTSSHQVCRNLRPM